MSLTITDALVSIGAAGASQLPQLAGGSIGFPSGMTLIFSLQSTTLVQRWELSIASDDKTLDGLSMTWLPGQLNQLTLPTPSAPFLIRYQSFVSDSQSSTAKVTGQVFGYVEQAYPVSASGVQGTAFPNFPTDDTSALDAAYAAVIAVTGDSSAPRKLYLPNTSTTGNTAFYRNRPLFIQDQGVEVVGEYMTPAGGVDRSAIVTGINGDCLPAVVVMRPQVWTPSYQQETPRGTTGSVWTVQTGKSGGGSSATKLLYEVSNTRASNINGATSFTFKCFINPKSLTLGAFQQYPIFGSNGAPDTSTTSRSLFFFLEGDGTGLLMQCTVNTSTTAFSGVGGTGPYLIANTLNYMKCTYDGANIKWFLNGVLETTTACTGAIAQAWYESVQLLSLRGIWPDQGSGLSTDTITIGGMQLELGVVDNSTGMLNAAPVADANTNLCCDWKPSVLASGSLPSTTGTDSVQPSWLLASDNGGKVWLLGFNSGGDGIYCPNVTLSHVQMIAAGTSSTGLFTSGALRLSVEKCSAVGTQGMTLDNFSYNSKVADSLVQASATNARRSWGISILNGTQFVNVTNLTGVEGGVAGQSLSLVFVENGSIDGCYLIANGLGGTRLIQTGSAGPIELHNFTCLDDGTTVTESLLYCNGIPSLSVDGGEGPVVLTSSVPAVKIGGCGTARFNTNISGGSGHPCFAGISGTAQVSPVIWGGNQTTATAFSDGTVPIVILEKEFTGKAITPTANAAVVLETSGYATPAFGDGYFGRYRITTGGWTGAQNFQFPANPGKFYYVHNQNAQSANITRTGSSSPVTLTTGSTNTFYDNGTDMVVW